MSENAKKAGLIALIVVAIVAAAFGGKRLIAGDSMDVVKTVPPTPGFKSEKERFLEQQAAVQQSPVQPSGKDPGARDLGGSPGGG